MSYYSNPTANAAIGSVDGQLRRAQKEAASIREQQAAGSDVGRQLEKARRRYVGLFRLVFERELARREENTETES